MYSPIRATGIIVGVAVPMVILVTGVRGDLASPTKWTNVSNIKVFSSGSYECPYAITEDGKYYAWGNGTNNARGDNTTGDITYPKYIDTLPNILAPSFDFDGYDKILNTHIPRQC